MSYTTFYKQTWKNIPGEVDKEYLVVNSQGTYSSSTVANLHTRKYHGLFVAPKPLLGYDNHVLLSTLDETVHCGTKKFELGVHQYPGILSPQGHDLLNSFHFSNIPTWIYGNDEFELEKSMVLVSREPHLLIKYKVLRTKEKLSLSFLPFLAFRNLHHLRKFNEIINKSNRVVENGFSFRPYEEYDPLFLQFSKAPDFFQLQDWYYNIEYNEEKNRGYDFREDLFVPGMSIIEMEDDDELIVSISLDECLNPDELLKLFKNQAKEHKQISSFEECLSSASRQFIIKENENTRVVAGWHWFGTWGRDTFISIPGLYLASRNLPEIQEIISRSSLHFQDGLFANVENGNDFIYNSVDASLWFCWALQKIRDYAPNEFFPWKLYGIYIREILECYKRGTRYGIHMTSEGLISAGEKGYALTWMDAVINGEAVTPRTGMPVEVNALWYNAVCFAIELAVEAGDHAFVHQWKKVPETIRKSFKTTFWDPKKGYLADVVNGTKKDFSLRPNMILAISLPYSPVTRALGSSIFNVVEKELLTRRGLRSLARSDHEYKGRYYGDQETRDRAYHQGTVWPWLFGHYAEASIRVDPPNSFRKITSFYAGFEETLFEHGLGTISEIFDGDEPHLPRGAISQAWSVAELIRVEYLLNKLKCSNGIIDKR